MKDLKFIILLGSALLVFISFRAFGQALPTFNSTAPITQPAQEAITYNQYWLQNLTVIAPSPSKPVELKARFVPSDDQGHILRNPSPDQIVTINIGDIFQLANTNETVRTALGSMLTALNQLCQQQGKCQ